MLSAMVRIGNNIFAKEIFAGLRFSYHPTPQLLLEGLRGVNIPARANTRCMSNNRFHCRFLAVARPKMETKICYISAQ